MPVQLIKNDIVKMHTDAIVNPLNTLPEISAGLSGRILEKGGPELIKAYTATGECNIGEAKITPAYNLPAKYVIHTSVPQFLHGKSGNNILLQSCYENALILADEYRCESIAFPLIYSGHNGFTKEYSLNIAMRTIERYLFDRSKDTDIDVYIVIHDKEALSAGNILFPGIRTYIDNEFLHSRLNEEQDLASPVPYLRANTSVQDGYCTTKDLHEISSLEEKLSHLDESFSEMLRRKICEKGIRNSECYKKANIDRKLFSKIINDPFYKPKKTTAVAFAISLELPIEETNELLGKAGYILSRSDKFDIIIRYVIENGNYRINDINIVLFEYNQPLLGSI